MADITKKEKRCACLGQTLDRFIQPVMLAIFAQEPCTGYAMIKKMREYVTFSENGPDPTGAYRYLKTLEQRGLVCREGGDVPGETPLYRITKEGMSCLSSWVETLRAYEMTVHTLADQLEHRIQASDIVLPETSKPVASCTCCKK